MLVYLNGKYIPRDQAFVSVDDRGFIYADGLYEVIRSYHGHLFLAAEHLQRLATGLNALRIRFDDPPGLEKIAQRLLTENDLLTKSALVYIQITRGMAFPRRHAFPLPEVAPTVYVATNPLLNNPENAKHGIAVITVPDIRWGRCDLKSTNLLANVLANQQAVESGADEAIFVRDGIAVEGSRSSLFAVWEGTVYTHSHSEIMLPGITQQFVMQLCHEQGIPLAAKPIPVTRLRSAEELFITQTTGEILPVIQLDGQKVASGNPGPITRQLQQAFEQKIARLGE